MTVDGNVNAKSFDFVSHMSRMVGDFYKIFSATTCDMGDQLVDTLVEVIQGPCPGNQIALIQAKIIDSSRDFIAGFDTAEDLLPIGFTEDDFANISEFKSGFVTLLLSLLEGDLDVDKVEKMANALDFKVVKDRLLAVFTHFAKEILERDDINMETLNVNHVNDKLIKDSFEGGINEAFELYILMQTLAANSETARNNISRKTFNAE